MGNILWVASYPKSGNTWMRTFIQNYIENTLKPININSIHEHSTAESYAYRYQKHCSLERATTDLTIEEICAIRPLVHKDIANQANGTIFVKTHNYLGSFRGHPLHTSSVSSGSIYIVRNPLDIVISMSNYFNYSIDKTIDYMSEEMTGTPNEKENVPQLISSWSLHVKSWTQTPDPSCLILRYEDILKNSRKVFRKVESFLKLKKDPARLKRAIKNSSFGQLKIQEKKHGFVEKHENANSFFRKGEINQWQKKLTDLQIQKIIDHHEIQMKRFKYFPSSYRT